MRRGRSSAWSSPGGASVVGHRSGTFQMSQPPVRDWCKLRSHTLRFRGHPQETTENSVDLGHLRYVHGYDNVQPVGSVTVEDAYLKSCFDFSAVFRVAGLKFFVSNSLAVTHLYGLGYSFVEIHEKTIDIDARLWILATPVDGTHVDLTLVSQMREIRKPRQFIAGLGFLPVKLRHRLMNRIFLSEEKRYVRQDVAIWERKRYQNSPRLCRADGPIGTYRRYCRQFYPDSTIATGNGDAISD